MRRPQTRSVTEIGIEATDRQKARILGFLKGLQIPYFVEPEREPPYQNIKELKDECES